MKLRDKSPAVAIYNIKYQNDTWWVSQNTTLYYGVRCQKIDNMFRPLCCVLTHPPDIILIFDTVIAHNGDEPLKEKSGYLVLNVRRKKIRKSTKQRRVTYLIS